MANDEMPKSALRALALGRRAALSNRAERSLRICERLAALDLYQRSLALHCYLPMRSEASTLPLLAQALASGKRVAVPVTQQGQPALEHSWLYALDDLERGAFGTPQPRVLAPCDPALCDLVLVPLLGFDRRCRRLGYGKGHYDRLLATLHAPRVGVAFAAQEFAHIPADAWDVALDAIVTEDEVVTIV